MLEKNPGAKYPAKQAIEAMIANLLITVEDTYDEQGEELLEAMRYVYANGDARYASFLLGPQPILDYFAVRDQLEAVQFWTRLLHSPAVLDQVPWLGETYFETKDITFEPLSAYYLDGDLAQTLIKGGAYRYYRYPGTAADAKELGLGFCSGVFEQRYDEQIVCKTKDAWASWFMMAPWDNTWLGLDRRARRFWMLCTTDTD